MNCYRAESGVIRTGPVRIGRDAVVGEETVLDIDTSLGDGAAGSLVLAARRGAPARRASGR